jgi:hypothetical protein
MAFGDSYIEIISTLMGRVLKIIITLSEKFSTHYFPQSENLPFQDVF